MYFQVLERNGVASGGHIIVLTDGGENVSPYVRDIKDEVLEKVRFRFIFLTEGCNFAILNEGYNIE